LNFNNEVTEIPFARFLPPRSMSMKCQKEEVPKGELLRKKPIMATKLPKFKRSEEREKKDCGNQVAEIQGEREKKGIKKGW